MLPVHVTDLAEAILLGALRGEPGRAYTAWSGERITFGEYFDRLVEPRGLRCRRVPRALLAGGAGLLSRLPAALAGNGPALGPDALVFIERRGSVSNARIREELGWEPRIGIDAGLAALPDDLLDPGSGGPSEVTPASAGASP
jgi:nucleoside-diphosphate-sugar epimerase